MQGQWRAGSISSGAWQAILNPMDGNWNGRELVVRTGDESLVIREVLVGEIWHASGQSNMVMTMGAIARKLELAQRDMETLE